MRDEDVQSDDVREGVATFADLTRCEYCGAHLLNDCEPVCVTGVGEREAYVPGSRHLCRGSFGVGEVIHRLLLERKRQVGRLGLD